MILFNKGTCFWMTNTRYFFALNTPCIVLVNMRVIVISVFQILQMLVNHIGGWKCTLSHMRNTLPGGSGIQSRLQLSTFEYFTRKPTLELNYFEFNSIFEYFYLNPIHNSSIMNMYSLLS